MKKFCKQCLTEKELSAFDKYRSTCRKCRNNKNMKSWLSNPDNVEKRKKYQREYQKEKRENDPNYKSYQKCLRIIRGQINSNKNNELKKHLESLFTEKMNWSNYGTYWEVDHINPALKMIKAGYTIEEVNKLTNLRPLSIQKNRERSKK